MMVQPCRWPLLVVDYLKREGLLQAAPKVGHPSGRRPYAILGLLFHALRADIIIVGMGPRIVGTKWALRE